MDYITGKNVIKGIASPALDFCGVYDAMLSRRVFGQSNWLILMYHRVIDLPEADPFRLGMCIGKRRFAEQIEYHTRHFTPISLGDAAARIRAGKPLPRNAVSITFDDGYRDFKEAALPVLKHYQCPSTVFVTTGGLQEGESFWWDRVIDAVATTNRKQVDIRFLAPGAPVGELPLTPRHRRRTLTHLQNLLWEQPPERIDEMVERLREQLGVTVDGSLQAPRLRHADIGALAREGVELGAHCERHVDMRRLSVDECQHELEASRRLLQELSGQPVDGFAYPGGRENSRVRKLVARAGFTYATGTTRGLNRQPYDMLSLQRVGMPDSAISDYKRCLADAAGAAPSPVRFESIPWS
ncbi:MAG TPA: polysaccharide deacetylase family protein [Gammaproteobacteria bacterium]